MNRSMLLQRIVRFKDDIASGEIASAGAMKKACKVIVLRIEQIIPDDSVLLQEWREKLQIIRHVKKTFVKEPEKSAAFEYLVDQMATREGISNSLAAKIKRGVKDNMKLFHPAGGENMSNARSSQQQQQQQQRSKGPRNCCFNCGGPHYAIIDVPRDRVSLDTLLISLGQLLQCLLPLWVEEGGVEAGLVGEGDGRY